LLLFWQLELLASIYAVYRGCWHWNSFQDNSATPTHILTMVTRFLSLVFPHFPCIFLRLTQMILFVCGYVFIMWKLFLAPAEYLRYCDLDGFLWYSMWRILFNLVRLAEFSSVQNILKILGYSNKDKFSEFKKYFRQFYMGFYFMYFIISKK